MAWRKPTSDDLAARLSDMEIEAFRTSWTGEGDPIERLLGDTAALFRGAIRTGGRSRMSPVDGTLPEAAISKAMDYAAYDVLKRIDIVPNEARSRARTDADDFLKRLEEGRFEAEDYEEPNGEDPRLALTPSFTRPRPPRLLD